MRWATVRIDDIKAETKHSLVGGPFGSDLVTRDYVEAGIPVIRGINLPDERLFSEDDFVFVREEKADSLLPNNAYPGDLILTQRGTLGQVGLIPKNSRYQRFVISQSQMKLTVSDKKADARFVYYFFRSPHTVQKIKNLAISSGVPHINLGILKDIEIPLPPMPSQQRIAEVLSSYDGLIENNRRRIALLEESARLLYKEWFVRLRFPGYEHTRIVDGVPEGWERKALPEITSYINRGIAPHYDEDGEGTVINQKCIRNRTLDLSLARRQSKEYSPAKQVQVGDVLINSTGEGTLGRVAQVKSPFANCTVDSHVTIVRPKPEIPLHGFGLAMTDREPHFSVMGRGATNQTELSRAAIAEVSILIPSHPIAQAFEECADPIYKEITNLVAQNSKLKKARDLLLPRLMSGAIEV